MSKTTKGRSDMRSDLLKDLFQAFAENDTDKFIRAANEIIRDEERKKHGLLAKDLKDIISTAPQTTFKSNALSKRYKTNIPIPRDTEKGFPLLEIKDQYYNLDDVILSDELEIQINYIIKDLKSSELLRKYGLRPKQKILFCGPPGTGKTLSSKVISSVIGFPLVYVRFDSIVSSFLGETATNLRKIFDFINQGEWVVLFDEFDIIGKRRDDPYEHGEIKRVVNNFMQMLDGFEGKSLLIAATNHEYLLDSAIWRRFDDILYFDLPDAKRRRKLFDKYLKVMSRSGDLDVNRFVNLTEGFSAADIAQICEEALRRIVINNNKYINNEDINWAISQQKRRMDIIKEK
jgi:SpoVK/Ycf46/Vps4 family AAA+-type ATPase